ncbi:GNAT family N-acetyltransferase [Cellulophaga sp. 20_2_10]|uniref:GNAT family N-acetyltransferase n=1 Tax=Cellulophaga sp. 20_2_10 TaxID=2942476 RepID=UPI00201A6335|nr:GNAT family N-acetyltransferase [Cellulophaga sp. 20_2_10]MCL5244805.1 GNAT family N-acetyltransferase [Cellulophaga sp. 20_2_10]
MAKHTKTVFLKGLFFNDNTLPFFEKIAYQTKTIYTTKNTNIKYNKNTFYEVVDVPDYLDIDIPNEAVKLKKIQLKTLKGYLVETKKYTTVEEYLTANFGTKSRSNLRRYNNRLEKCFNITYTCYYGDISKEKYNSLFVALKALLIRRFEEKKENNYELRHFDEYQDTIYNLIVKKEASIFVIYNDQKPISIRINMFKETLGYYIMSCYDIDYSKFHLGSLDMLKNIEWCIKNNIITYDLLKGYDYYKKDWKTTTFDFYNYLIYDPSAIQATFNAYAKKAKTKATYKIYDTLKKIHFITYYKKVKQKLHRKAPSVSTEKKVTHTKLEVNERTANSVQLDFDKNEAYFYLKRPIFNLLFTSQEHSKDIKVYKNLEDVNNFYVIGKNNKWSLHLID